MPRGGAGLHRGGDGLVRALRFREPLRAAILSGHGMSTEHRAKTAGVFSKLWDAGHLSVSRATGPRVERYGRRVALHWLIQPMAAAEALGAAVVVCRCGLGAYGGSLGADLDKESVVFQQRSGDCDLHGFHIAGCGGESTTQSTAPQTTTATPRPPQQTTLFSGEKAHDYLKGLAEDIGAMLGCGGHVIGLRRTGVGPYVQPESRFVTLSEIEAIVMADEEGSFPALDALLLPLESALDHWPAVRLTADAAFYLRQGQAVLVPQAPTEGLVRLYDPSLHFLGVGCILDDGKVQPKRLL